MSDLIDVLLSHIGSGGAPGAVGLDLPHRIGDQTGHRGEHHLAWACCVERMTGIEPAYSAWEADVLPLNYIHNVYCLA